jgi:hypothetical protein
MGRHSARPARPYRRASLVTAAAAAALIVTGGGAALASPQPSTNGGNGAGQSGQCTGPAAERPAACQSP